MTEWSGWREPELKTYVLTTEKLHGDDLPVPVVCGHNIRDDLWHPKALSY